MAEPSSLADRRFYRLTCVPSADFSASPQCFIMRNLRHTEKVEELYNEYAHTQCLTCPVSMCPVCLIRYLPLPLSSTSPSYILDSPPPRLQYAINYSTQRSII
jgi:hypothetical protein